ncbi:MAG: hypothetical protein U0R44_06785 [Candidatus Micrarchaeia archaeon]
MTETSAPERGPDSGEEVHTLKLSGMTCGACEKLIERVVSHQGAEVKEIDANSGVVKISCSPARIEAIKNELALKGFRERDAEDIGERGDPRRILAYIGSVIAGEPHVQVESRLMNYALGATAILTLGAVASFSTILGAFGSTITAASLLFFVVLSSVMSVYAFAHMNTYRKWMTCTNGMMVGMTSGMASGYMVGAVLGATNGMFIGSVAGMAVGIGIGLALGRYSGIMGAMEGMMAGLMSGTMGAMTTVMMINDNVLAFMYILSGICLVMVGGLSYMMFREAGPAPREGFRGGFAVFAWMCIALSALMVAVILYGPKNGIILH